jgi:hypothetical protein
MVPVVLGLECMMLNSVLASGLMFHFGTDSRSGIARNMEGNATCSTIAKYIP